MTLTIHPKKLQGTLTAIPSKSAAHRLLICAAFADKETYLHCPQTNRDIEATASCLEALGAKIRRDAQGYHVKPIVSVPRKAELFCGESGSTLRFLLPVAGALGVDATFRLEGRLGKRPLSPMWEEMERMGCQLSRPSENSIFCTGKLRAGLYRIDGGVSSQFITGLLFATALLESESQIEITGKLESKPYVDMTLQAMELFGVKIQDFSVPGGCRFTSPGNLEVEGDWSNAAFFLAANALGSRVQLQGLRPDSAQGDRLIADLVQSLDLQQLSCRDIPDLVPILSVVAAGTKGGVFRDIARLRLKESDRVQAILDMLAALGIRAEADENTLTVYPGQITGGIVDSKNDHRIAMAAAIAATVAEEPIIITDAQCVEKSYPSFWEDYESLGGHYEQHIR